MVAKLAYHRIFVCLDYDRENSISPRFCVVQCHFTSTSHIKQANEKEILTYFDVKNCASLFIKVSIGTNREQWKKKTQIKKSVFEFISAFNGKGERNLNS